MTLMQDRNSPPSAGEQRRKDLVLWLALAFSVIAYAGITRLVPAKAPQDDSGLLAALAVVSLGLVAASFQIKKRMQAKAADANDIKGRTNAFILALVLCESAALSGLVLWFVAGSPIAYVLMGLGFAGMLLHYPKSGG